MINMVSIVRVWLVLNLNLVLWWFPTLLVGAVYGKEQAQLASYTIASETKSCMMLTRSMTTTNNVQGDEPHTATLERQVQTLATTVECLTKQNRDLEEQLR